MPQDPLDSSVPDISKRNCTTWAEYETPGSSRTANLCNGGWYTNRDGSSERYEACLSRYECKQATARERVHLPVVQQTNPERPFGNRPSSTIVGSSPNLPSAADRLYGGSWAPAMPSNLPQRQPTGPGMPAPSQVQVPLPYPVQPPKEWPQAMHTPYAGPTPVHGGGITPTFLPSKDESIFSRLFLNVAQGMIGASGWHVFDYSRTVDLFSRPRR